MQICLFSPNEIQIEKAECSFSNSLKWYPLISFLVLSIKLRRSFTISWCTFFIFVRKQSQSVVYVLSKAVLFFKNLKNIVKQCVSYSNLRIFLNIWKIFVFNHRNWMFFSLFTCFYTIMLKATQKIDQSVCCKYMGN